jgi:hypothetical protein
MSCSIWWLYGYTAIVAGVQDQRTTAMGRDVSGSFRLTLVACDGTSAG